ncbi:MAG: TonB-dependent receptor [Chryseosolibacter sp.]
MNRLPFVITLIITCLLPAFCNSQSLKDILISPADNGRILSEFLEAQEKAHGIDFICDAAKMRSFTLNGIVEKQRFSDYLNDKLAGFRVFRYSDNVVFIIDQSIAEKYALKKENFLLFRDNGRAGTILKGAVLDAINSDPLPGAKVVLPNSRKTEATDIEGRFNVGSVAHGIVTVEVEYVGYEPNHYVIGFSSMGDQEEIVARLLPESRELEGVTITADRVDENVTAKITGIENLSIGAMKALPAFMGEVDPIRSLTTLPGVSTVGELASGFNVRGGESGQNLVMQDGATIYNPSHLFGFFSAFNPDMVNNVTLYKGGGPANFGTRISSVLDVSLRNGDANKHTVSGGVGLISGRLTVEGPIARNKSSYLIGGRFAYPNWLVKATDNISLRNSAANFRDFTGKIFHTVNENNYLTLSGYHSYDDFKLATDSIFSWRTTNISLKWDHTFHEKLYSTLTAFNSNYFSEVHSISEIEGFKYYNSIRSIGLKYDITQVLADDSKIIAGFETNGTLLEPGRKDPDDAFENILAEDMQDQRSLEAAVYTQWDKDLSDKWSVSAGLRYGYFVRLGAEEIYTFDYTNIEGRYPSVSDSVSYQGGEVIQRYSGLEPRISFRYLINQGTSVKASYYRGFQYLHLISNTSSATPQDYWVTSGPYLRPQRGDQYSLGLFKNLKDNRYEFSLEGFYKEIDNAVDYIDGADITLNPALEAGLSQGKGLAYGMEVLVKKATGRTNGWLAYTYSRSLRKFDGGEEGNIMINRGAYYASAFDQPHHVTLILNYQLGARSFLSANFNYSTGRPITIPISKYSYDAYLSVLNYSERNDYRIDDYHRLDLSWTLKDKPRANKRFRSEWVVSLFNVYSRKNTYSVSFNRYGTASKLSVLGSIFPSVNYNFRF